jgi:hypothetical protein
LVRLTIQDENQTISFLVEEATLLRLIAGCSINPADLSELLVASDIYQRGLASELMADLMDFDKAIHNQGPEFIHKVITQAEQTGQELEMAFQVIDEITKEEALRTHLRPLVVINLNTRTIRTSQEVEIQPAGEVCIQIGGVESERKVSYILPQEWKIEQL